MRVASGFQARPAEREIVVGGGVRLRARLWDEPAARATLVIAHGHGEHGGCYAEFAQSLRAGLNVRVLAFDFRGHGRSSGRRGVVHRWEDLLADLDAALADVRRLHPGQPVFLLGHSNGGLAALRYAEGQPGAVAGLILSNPAVRLTAEAPWYKLAVGRLLLAVAPWVTLQTGIRSDQLTVDAAQAEALEADPLCHRRISPPTYFGMVRVGPLALRDAPQITAPTLLIVGEADGIADPATNRALFDRLGTADKTLRVFAGMRHEPLQEVGRPIVFAAIRDWLADRIDGLTTMGQQSSP